MRTHTALLIVWWKKTIAVGRYYVREKERETDNRANTELAMLQYRRWYCKSYVHIHTTKAGPNSKWKLKLNMKATIDDDNTYCIDDGNTISPPTTITTNKKVTHHHIATKLITIWYDSSYVVVIHLRWKSRTKLSFNYSTYSKQSLQLNIILLPLHDESNKFENLLNK